eukprot:2441706-Rhodomonas_salina.2
MRPRAARMVTPTYALAREGARIVPEGVSVYRRICSTQTTYAQKYAVRKVYKACGYVHAHACAKGREAYLGNQARNEEARRPKRSLRCRYGLRG